MERETHEDTLRWSHELKSSLTNFDQVVLLAEQLGVEYINVKYNININ